VADATVDEPPQPLAALVRQRNFWWLALGFGICGTTVGLISTHLIPYAEDLRIDPVTAATAFGVLGAVNVTATLAAGAISDRWGHQRLLGTIYAGRAVVLIFLPFVHDPTTLFVFAIAFGAAYFPSVPPPRRSPPRSLGVAQGERSWAWYGSVISLARPSGRMRGA
jgi:MFS family permease